MNGVLLVQFFIIFLAGLALAWAVYGAIGWFGRAAGRRIADLTREERTEEEARRVWPPSPTDPPE